MGFITKKAALLAAGGVVVASLGVFAGMQDWSSLDSVQESAPLSSSAPRTPSGSLPAKVTPDSAPYLSSLPEPENIARTPPKVAPAAAVRQPEKVEALFPAAEPVSVAKAGGDCSAGARPMGDCNCFDERVGKVSLRLHPSDACVDEESKRLGHRVLLASNPGHFELAGIAPERAPEVVEVAATPVVKKKRIVIVQQAALEPEESLSPATAAETAKPGASRPPLFEFIPFSPPGGLAATPQRHLHQREVASATSAFSSVPGYHAPEIHITAPPISPIAPPGETPILSMSRCGIGGHDVHVTVFANGAWLHIRHGISLSPSLNQAEQLVLAGAMAVTVYKTKMIVSDGSGERAIPISSPPGDVSGPGIEDYNAAVAYAQQLECATLAAAPAPPPSRAPTPLPPTSKQPVPVPVLTGGAPLKPAPTSAGGPSPAQGGPSPPQGAPAPTPVKLPDYCTPLASK